MPLSPEDVVQKRFNPTRVREGYAQDEVDDFLDEVVAELRRLTGENAELRGQLGQCQARVTELQRDAAAPVATAGTETVDLAEDAAPAQVQPVAPAPVAAAPVMDPTEKAAGVIALAQRLHDEYVRDGEAQRDALVSGAQEQAATVVAEAEARRDRTLGELDGRRQQLEESITQLHGRETSYREQLDTFISTQLDALRRSGRVVPDDAVSH